MKVIRTGIIPTAKQVTAVHGGISNRSLGSHRHRRKLLDYRHALRLGTFIGIYFGSAVTACWLAPRFSASEPLWIVVTILSYILAAASLHGISLFTHEAVHDTLSANRFVNASLGSLCAIPVLQNYSAYRILHLRHHDHLGQEGDPDHYPNYTRWSWMVFLMNWGGS